MKNVGRRAARKRARQRSLRWRNVRRRRERTVWAAEREARRLGNVLHGAIRVVGISRLAGLLHGRLARFDDFLDVGDTLGRRAVAGLQ